MKEIMNKTILTIITLFMLFCCSQNNSIISKQLHKVETIYLSEKEDIKDLGNGCFEVTSSAIIQNISPEEARDLAIQKACKIAIEYYSGVEVTGRTSLIQAESNDRIQIDHFSNLINQTSQGIILKKEILEEKTESIGNILQKVIIIKVKIGKQKGEIDPYFKLEANLNKEYFLEGETLELTVIPSQDCYLTILNITSNENVTTIFPNQYRKDNFVKSKDVFSLPNDYDKSIGLIYELSLIPDRTEDTEIVKIIATKKPVNFKVDGNFQTAFESLQNWLITIPRNEIEEVDLQYYIYK